MKLFRTLKKESLVLLMALALPFADFAQCPDCCNGVQDCSETGVDCGGPDCLPCGNLVPNGSFDCLANCFVFGPGQIQAAVPWTYVDVTEPSDLFNTCFTFDVNILAPNNFRGSQAPHSGNGYAGFQAQNDPFSDPRAGYVQVALTSPLTPGQAYDLSFWVSRADNYGMAMGGLGAYFSVGPVAPGDYAPLNMHGYNPQVASDLFIHITDATNWTNITGSYVATGGETHIILGNFKTTFSPPSPLVTYICCTSNLSYYYIDDVSLVASGSFPVTFSGFEAKAEKGRVRLNWRTASETNSDHFVIERGSDGLAFEAIGQEPAAGKSTSELKYAWYDEAPVPGKNYYRIRQFDRDGASILSEVLEVEFVAGLKIERFSLSANGTSLDYELSGAGAGSVTVELFDLTGKMKYREDLLGKSNKVSNKIGIEQLSTGMYFLRFRTKSEILTKRFVLR